MAIPLGETHFFGGVSSKLVLEAGLALGVPDVSARRILKEVVTRLPIALEREMVEMRKRHAAAPEGAKVHLAAEDRLLRVMEHIIVKDMLDRLSR